MSWRERATAVAAPSGWRARAAPVQAEAPPSGGEAFGRGAAQGATLGFGDEAQGLVQADPGATLNPLMALARATVGRPQSDATVDLQLAEEKEQKAPTTARERLAKFIGDYRGERDSARAGNEAAKAAHPGLYLGGNLAGGLATAAALPGGQGSKLLQLMKAGAQAGAVGGLGGSDADLTQGDVLGAAKDTGAGALIGAAGGAAGAGLGAGLGKLAQMAGGRAAGIEAQVGAKAAEEAAAGTASARSAAGRAAQDAYRQLEHLRELGAVRALTPDEAQVAATLEQELAQKAQEKLVPAAEEKAAKAAEYQQAIASEAQRAKQGAAEKLSPGELLSQVGARLKRYGPAVLGGAVGHSLLPGMGTGAGIAAGLYLRPALRSIITMAKQPVVQHGLARALESIAGGLGSAAEGAAGPAARAVEPKLERELLQLIPQLAGGDDDLAKQKALAQALRGLQ